MRILVCAHASVGHGTQRLARALTGMGFDGGHEIIGQCNAGSITPLASNNRQLYKPPEGYVLPTENRRDNIMGATYHAVWQQYRGLRNTLNMPDAERHLCIAVLRAAMQPYLEGEGFFVDINGFLGEWWPIMALMPELQQRCIHLVRDGRAWVRKLHWYAVFTKDRETIYGDFHHDRLRYGYPVKWPGTPHGYSPFQAICFYWKSLHEWYLTAGAPVFRVEDYNKPETARAIWNALFPETKCTEEIAREFHQKLYALAYEDVEKQARRYSDGKYGLPPWHEMSKELRMEFERICGETMEKLGYAM